jgi:cyclophilin family peptidyl-prolyl cis-trans isomerase
MIKYLFAACLTLATTGAWASDAPQIRLDTSEGIIEIELNAKAAPKTVENFMKYVKDGFYNGIIFHRVIKNFMIQGGGFTPDFVQKTTRPPVQNEATNGLKNDRGTIAMARTMNPHSATAQFFINTVNNDPLNFRDQSIQGWGYTVFGKVTKGMDVVDKIQNSMTIADGPFDSDVPHPLVMIRKVEIIRE